MFRIPLTASACNFELSTKRLQLLHKFVYDPVRCGGTGRNTDGFDAFEQGGVQVLETLQMEGTPVEFAAYLGQPRGISTVEAAQYEHDIDLLAEQDGRLLSFTGFLA